MKWASTSFLLCWLVLIVTGNYHSKVETSQRHKQKLKNLHKQANDFVENNKRPSAIVTDDDSNVHTKSFPQNSQLFKEDALKVNKNHHIGRPKKSSGRGKWAKGQRRDDLERPAFPNKRGDLITTRNQIKGHKLIPGTRQAQKLLNNKHRKYQKARRNGQQDAMHHLQKVKSDLKHKHKHPALNHVKPVPSADHRQHMKASNRNRNPDRSKKNFETGRRMTNPGGHVGKEKMKVKKTHRFQ